MKTIIVKVFNSIKQLNEVVVNNSSQIITIPAQADVHYDFIDDMTKHAPNHIITRRVEQDLYVNFEYNYETTNLIIQGFYNYEGQALVGLAESGDYYHYIPDSGDVANYVTRLQADDIQGHALGGNEMAGPFWMPDIETSGIASWIPDFDSSIIPFGIFPAVGGLLLAGSAYKWHKHHEEKNDADDTNNPSIQENTSQVWHIDADNDSVTPSNNDLLNKNTIDIKSDGTELNIALSMLVNGSDSINAVYIKSSGDNNKVDLGDDGNDSLGGFTKTGTVDTYDVYTNDGETLYVDKNIEVL